MSFVDEERLCRDCKNKFMFAARDQEFYAQKGFTAPNRCKPCRDLRKANGGGQQQNQGGGGYARQQPQEPIREYRNRPRVEMVHQAPVQEEYHRPSKRSRQRYRDSEFGDGVDW